MKILFVDEENAYEGPIAEAVADDVFAGSEFEVEVRSRGLEVPEGKQIGNFTQVVLAQLMLELNRKSMDAIQLKKEDIEWADVVLTMTNEQKAILTPVCPAEKLHTFFEYTMESDDDLTSPKGYSLSGYKACLCGVGEALGTLLEKWQDEKGNE